MFKKEAIFNAEACVTPDFAAKLANVAGQYESVVYLERNGISLCVDSLISILSMNLRKGGKVIVVADGSDAREAVEAVCVLLAG